LVLCAVNPKRLPLLDLAPAATARGRLACAETADFGAGFAAWLLAAGAAARAPDFAVFDRLDRTVLDALA
jgi:hypothetical protein